MQRAGIIGLGLLGSAIAQRLMKAGYLVVGFDVDPVARERLSSQGGSALPGADAVFAETSQVILSLPDSPTVRQVLQEAFVRIEAHHTISDTTTGSPDETMQIADDLAGRGARFLEANVAGSSVQLARGEAVLLLGGDEQTLAASKAILSAISSQQHHVGGPGGGARFKLVHNLILGLNRAVLAEGLTFAESLGFEGALTLEILRATPAASRVMETKGDKMIRRDYAPQARLSQHLKDVRLILSEAVRSGAATPLSQLHRELLEQAEAAGWGDADNSSICEVFRNVPGEFE